MIDFRGKKQSVEKKETSDAQKELQTLPLTPFFESVEDVTGERGSIRGSAISVSKIY